MNPRLLKLAAVIFFVTSISGHVSAQERTPAFTAEEREAAYNASIEKRTTNILNALQLTDAAKAARVHDAIIAQYKALRARDEALDTLFIALAKDSPGIQTNRAAILPVLSATLHEEFISRLSTDLTPQQVVLVKDKLTYNKVNVTYEAYCAIVPNLSDAEKASILKTLGEAREEAIDGGSADEKTAIFQKHKDTINAYLNSKGHDVAKATAEWEAKQDQASAASGNTTSPAKQ